MASLRSVHYWDRQKTAAVISEGGDAQCQPCFLEMTPEEREGWEKINCVELDRFPGRTTRCCWCGERLLDRDGMPLIEWED